MQTKPRDARVDVKSVNHSMHHIFLLSIAVIAAKARTQKRVRLTTYARDRISRTISGVFCIDDDVPLCPFTLRLDLLKAVRVAR